ncbi:MULTISPECIES: flagellar hook-basal body complex protein [unclassified Methylobacterium]|uniref:flagellar hook protein FlgE n=1 Tax=unclassified Methylobacterium TaxID=2615210 RepID=UPI0006F3EF05|nr:MULTISPECIES: flagellar hook-basal body complex protein [unclassified Methylobacterium]KQP50528.1 flagellar biosynthesis protein FlgE [Methylobacterium sp. Leaf108]KQT78775.1 flagellar biosynthesis protein FlgE [Methylobacterium sp. Leaf466]
MDVFTALQTAVSGLKAQSFSLNNISGNIANSQTTGYKRIDTNFVDLIAEQQPGRQVAGSVLADSRLTTTIQGGLNATNVGTNIALNGDGFFTVQSKTSDANGQPTFSTAEKFTRRGDFAPDKDGYLVNGAGSYLKGSTLDPATGQASSEGPIKISNALLAAQPTSTITYSANLPKVPATTNASAALPGSELLAPFGTAPNQRDPRILSGTGTASVAAGDAQSLVNNSVVGPTMTLYSASGGPVSLATRWAKVQTGEPATGTAAATDDVWNLFYANNSTAGLNQSPWTNAGTAFGFNASGQLTAPAATSITVPDVTIDGINLNDLTLRFGSGGLTQYNTSDGRVTTNTQQQDGYASGSLISTEVTEDGTIAGTYSNGSTLSLAKINVVQFTNSDGLKSDSGGNYEQTIDSGPPLVGLKGSTVIGGTIEQSNTDIASEFSKMIVTQQAYSANTKVMSTAQDMMSALINIIR